MIESLVLIEGNNVKKETLSISLANAKHLVIGAVPPVSGWILHVAATTSDDLGKALLKFAQVPGVTGVLTLTLRT
ncbi:MAG: hypothetical protein M3R14_12960 [Acidobacteriota bacterium]|nr:hypothetical protein [Acidobacteriota bacterium]